MSRGVTEPEELWRAKNAFREYASARRRLAYQQCGPGAGVRAADHFLANIPVLPAEIVSGYWPIREEFDVVPLLRRLCSAGYHCALPYVDKSRHTLIFREWRPGTAMCEGAYRIPEPTDMAAVLVPTLLLVPLLAYDAEGFRLGYGGGYYDRYIEKLSNKKNLFTIGIAHSCQKINKVPTNRYDKKLDIIITEKYVLR